MDAKLSEIIEKIKAEGVEKGKQKADELLEQAKHEAKYLVQEAKTEAESIVNAAKEQADAIVQRGKDALQQAERDLILVVREKLIELLSKFAKQRANEALTPQMMSEFLKTVLSKWDATSADSIFVHLSKQDAQAISTSSLEGLITGGKTVEVKVDPQLSRGFMISRDNDGGLKYDFSDHAIRLALGTFLTQGIQELLE